MTTSNPTLSPDEVPAIDHTAPLIDGVRPRDLATVTFADLVKIELESARRIYPAIVSSHEAFSIILEELEEFRDQVRKRPHRRHPTLMLRELVQTAAMCQRAAEDLRLLSRAQEGDRPR